MEREVLAKPDQGEVKGKTLVHYCLNQDILDVVNLIDSVWSFAMNLHNLALKRFQKAERHYIVLKDYKSLIDEMLKSNNIFDVKNFEAISSEKRAILDAYLKRFSSMQDYLGAKIFPIVLTLAGINSEKMSDVLYHVEKEKLIDNLDTWLSLRNARNFLEHDYPDELAEALRDLKFCYDHFTTLEMYYQNAKQFAQRYTNAIT